MPQQRAASRINQLYELAKPVASISRRKLHGCDGARSFDGGSLPLRSMLAFHCPRRRTLRGTPQIFYSVPDLQPTVVGQSIKGAAYVSGRPAPVVHLAR